MSETDPWKVAKSTIRARIADYSVALLGHSSGSQQAKENAQTAIDVAIDAARAAEAAQHQQIIDSLRRVGWTGIDYTPQGVEWLAQETSLLRAERDRLKAALERLRDCDWTIGRGDRMDAVRDIARAALTPQGQSTDGETR